MTNQPGSSRAIRGESVGFPETRRKQKFVLCEAQQHFGEARVFGEAGLTGLVAELLNRRRQDRPFVRVVRIVRDVDDPDRSEARLQRPSQCEAVFAFGYPLACVLPGHFVGFFGAFIDRLIVGVACDDDAPPTTKFLGAGFGGSVEPALLETLSSLTPSAL